MRRRSLTAAVWMGLLIVGQPDGAAAQAAILAPPDPAALPSDLIEVRTNEAERVIDFVIGPINLPAGIGHYRAPIQIAEMPVDGWMHGFETEIRDGEGNRLPDELLHHVNLIDPDQRELFSPTARRVLAAGRETGRQTIPRLIGFPIQKGQRILVVAMLADDGVNDYPDAYLHVRLFYSAEGDGFLQPWNVYPFYLDVMGPLGVKDFPVPPGKSSMSWEAKPIVGGRILGIGGHVQDYATSIRLEDATTGKVLWNGKPERDENGLVSGVPAGKPWWRGGIKIRTDHVYRIVVDYDNPTDDYTPLGGMGAMGGVVLVSKNTAWPGFDKTDPAYVKDLTDTINAPMNSQGHAGMGTHKSAPVEADAGGAAADAGAEVGQVHEPGSEEPAHAH